MGFEPTTAASKGSGWTGFIRAAFGLRFFLAGAGFLVGMRVIVGDRGFLSSSEMTNFAGADSPQNGACSFPRNSSRARVPSPGAVPCFAAVVEKLRPQNDV